MFFALLLALIAAAAGYYIHQQFSPAAGTPEKPIPKASSAEGSKRQSKREAVSKRDAPAVVSGRSVYDTAANETSTRSVTGTEAPTPAAPALVEAPAAEAAAALVETAPTPAESVALENAQSSANAASQRDESSRDVKTARSPAPGEPTYAEIAAAAATASAPAADENNNIQLVKEGGGADAAAKSPNPGTAIASTESERLRGELGNLPDSTAKNVSPNPGASHRDEVKADPATASALSSEKKKKKRSSPKKSRGSKKSKEIKASD